MLNPATNPTPATPTGIALPILRSKLEETVQAPGRAYAKKSALIFYWQDDNTGAKEDAQALKEALKEYLGIDATLLGLHQQNRLPDIAVTNTYERIATKLVTSQCHSGSRQSLMMFAYIGHGSVNAHGKFYLESNSGTKVDWDILKSRIFADYDPSHLYSSIDVFGFLDCCYAGVATRTSAERSMQVLAACGLGQVARSGSRNLQSPATFTQRFCGELKQAYTHNRQKISVDKIFEEFVQEENVHRMGEFTPSGVRPPRRHFADCIAA